VAATVLFRSLSGDLGRMTRTEKEAQAVVLARSLLAGASIDPMRQGDAAGRSDDGFVWHVRVTPFGDAQSRREWPLSPLEVEAEVSWNGARDRPVTLRTVLFGQKEPSR
jgi:hypothetical protein